jgi:hypothetical protein
MQMRQATLGELLEHCAKEQIVVRFVPDDRDCARVELTCYVRGVQFESCWMSDPKTLRVQRQMLGSVEHVYAELIEMAMRPIEREREKCRATHGHDGPRYRA